MFSIVILLAAAPAPPDWQPLHAGVEYRAIRIVEHPTHADGLLHVVRINPREARLEVRAATALAGKNRTAGAWADEFGLVAVINAGMYETDFATHTGLLRVGKHVNSSTWLSKYKSALTIGTPAQTKIIDVTSPIANPGGYRAVVQNLRLIAGGGKNVWKENGRRWSEAAIAMDAAGRILFLFCRTPLSMHNFNQRVLAAGLGITHAHHAEGGPEASLSVRGGKVRLDLMGSYETGFNENNDNREQWKLPNVIAVVAK